MLWVSSSMMVGGTSSKCRISGRRQWNIRALVSVNLNPQSEPYGKTFWSPSPEQATPFGSQGEADAWKKATSDATGVTEVNEKW